VICVTLVLVKKTRVSVHKRMVHMKKDRYETCPLCGFKATNLDHHCKINHPEEYLSKSIPELFNSLDSTSSN
jgi:hypothetical protein